MSCVLRTSQCAGANRLHAEYEQMNDKKLVCELGRSYS